MLVLSEDEATCRCSAWPSSCRDRHAPSLDCLLRTRSGMRQAHGKRVALQTRSDADGPWQAAAARCSSACSRALAACVMAVELRHDGLLRFKNALPSCTAHARHSLGFHLQIAAQLLRFFNGSCDLLLDLVAFLLDRAWSCGPRAWLTSRRGGRSELGTAGRTARTSLACIDTAKRSCSRRLQRLRLVSTERYCGLVLRLPCVLV